MEASVALSAAVYDRAPVVVLTSQAATDTQLDAASAAVGLGVPLLLVPGATSASDTAPPPDGAPPTDSTESMESRRTGAVGRELRRLEPSALLTVGDAATAWAQDWVADQSPDVSVIQAQADGADQAARSNDQPTGESRSVAPEALAAEIAALDRGTSPAALPQGTTLPDVVPADALDELLVLMSDDHADVAAVATARAAGARLLLVNDPDPRADPETIAAVAAEPSEHVVALGDRFGQAQQLRQRLDVAETGVELPGGGQLVFPGRRFVALYGHPHTPAMGVLGEQALTETLARAQQQAAEYDALVDEPVIPALEIIATVASTAPGADGNYSAESSVEDLRPWVDAAGEAGIYVVLDLQPGHSDFLSQAQLYEELLAKPHVGLALDPEWRLAPGQRHLAQIGSVSASEVNTVITWLAELTRQRNLPQKLLVLHQFRTQMISAQDQLDTGRDEVAVLIHVDGFGTPGAKFETWNALHDNPPPGVWWGWKNFHDEDSPTFTPDATVAIEPTPRFVSYQ
jgi:hypothetical protein